MRPLKLKIAGLRSWRSTQEIDFADVSLLAIIGDTGAGKSSILEALTYALYGATTWEKGGVRALLADGEDTMRVELTFRAEDKTWTVVRSSSRGAYPPAVHSLRGGEVRLDKASEVNREIERLVGLDYDAFLRAVVLPQGRFALLLNAGDTDRTAILKGIFRLDELDEARELAEKAMPGLRQKSDDMSVRRAQLLPDPAYTLREAELQRGAAEATITALSAVAQVLHDARERVRDIEARKAHLDKLAQAMRSAAVADAKEAAEAGVSLMRTLDERLYLAEKADDEAREREETLLQRLQQQEAKEGSAADLARAEVTVENIRADRRRDEEVVADLAKEEEKLAAEAESVQTLETELGVVRAQLAPLQAAQKTAQDDAKLRAQALAEAERLLARAREKAQAEQRAKERDEAAKGEIREAQAQKALLEGQRAQAEQRFDLAKAALAEEERHNHAALAAEGSKAGDGCPVCARPLPEGFVAPAPTALTALTKARSKAEKDHQTALGLAEKASARASAAAVNGARVEAEVAEARSALIQEKEALSALIGEVDLRKKDATLLAEVSKRASEAAELAAQAAKSVQEAEGRQRDLATTLKHTQARRAERTESLRKQKEERTARHERWARDLAALPGDLATPSASDEALAALAATIARRQEHLKRLGQDLTKARNEGASTRRALQAVRDEVSAEEKRRQGLVQRVSLHATRVNDVLSALEQPGISTTIEGSSPLDVARWVNLVARSAREAEAGLSKARESDLAILTATRAQVDEALATQKLADDKALEAALVAAQADRKRASEDMERAAKEAPIAARLDETSNALTDLISSLEEVRRQLSDAKFVKFVVAQRQRALLVEASVLLGSMTAGRYGFSPSFEVVDRLSGQTRSPRTLSGGETFVASLSLALALVELAGRSGGRLEALFLDEGFGSLDASNLGEALAVLGQQASGGRLVAVISHLRAVAESIDDVLFVKRGPKGSEATWLRGKDRDALVEKDVEESLLG